MLVWLTLSTVFSGDVNSIRHEGRGVGRIARIKSPACYQREIEKFGEFKIHQQLVPVVL